MTMKRLKFSGSAATITAALLTALLAGCGVETKTGSNGTGAAPPPEATVASGPIVGLGPLGIAGTRLDDSATQVLLNATAAQTAGELRLGMFSDASGSVFVNLNAGGFATTAVAQSLVVGPLTRLDAAAQTLAVLGIPARVDQNTLLEGVNGLGELVLGDSVEVFGLKLPGNAGTLATRLIVRRPALNSDVEVLGNIGELNTASLTASGVPVSLANVQVGIAGPAGIQFSPPPANALVPGALIRVLGTYDATTGVVTATRIATGFTPVRPESRLVYIEGFVRDVTSATRFKVGDLDVDAAGTQATVVEGSRVKVRGRMQSGVLRADLVGIIPPGTRTEFVVEGLVAAYVSAAAFSVRGERFDAGQAAFAGGTASNLADGKRVRIKGVAGPGRITATEVTFIQ